MGGTGTKAALRLRVLALAGACASVTLGLLAGGTPAGGAQAKLPPPAEIGVEIVSTSQQDIVDRGRLKVEVTAPSAPMRIRAKGITADSNGRARVTDVRQARA